MYHRHFSSLRHRIFAGYETAQTRYQCPTCKSNHLPYRDSRLKVIVSDSTLHNYFAPYAADISLASSNTTFNNYGGDMQHCDYITIAGACIEDLVLAFRLEYGKTNLSRPLDVVLVAGYEDIIRGHSREFIEQGMKEFASAVKDQGSQHKESPNTIAIANLMYSPGLAWYPDNGPQPPRYRNQMEKIHWLNTMIHQLNVQFSSPYYPRFHKWGVRKATRIWKDTYGQEHHRQIKKHRWEHWRGADPREMIYLSDERRLKMAAAINNYFILRT